MRWLRQKLAKNPLAWLALAATAGVLLADATRAMQWLWGGTALTVGAATILRPRVWLLALSALFTFGFVHQVCLSAARDHPLRQQLKPGQRVSAILVGQFVRAPMVRDEGPANRQAKVRISHVDLPTFHKRVTGTTDIRVWLTDPAFVPTGGDYELQGTLNLVQRPWNPGGFDSEKAALRQGVIADFTVTSIRRIGNARPSLWLTLLTYAERSRNWISRQLAVGLGDQETPRLLITTMALGTYESGSADLQEPFRNSGTLHVFAVSGLHVGLMAIFGLLVLKWLGVRKSYAVAFLIPLVFGYAFITGWVPSAARSAFMSAVFLMAPMTNRSSKLINSLGFAALLLFGGGTLQLFQPGFQLSFGVLGAIALGSGVLTERYDGLARLDPFLPPMLASPWDKFSVYCRRKLLRNTAASLTAWAGSVPLMMAHFDACTPVAVIANLVLVPLSSMSLWVGAVTMMVATSPLGALQSWLNQLNAMLAQGMLISATGFSAIPGGHFPLSLPSFQERPPVTLEVLSMPIGEGAQLLSSAGEYWWLDCGSAKHSSRTTVPFLRKHGISRVDGMVLSHADAEHISAAPALMQRYDIEKVFVGPGEPWRFDSHATAMWQVANQAGDRLRRLRAGDTLRIGDAGLLVLYPRADDLRDKADDRAMIVRIDCGQMRVLWCSDAGFSAEKSLLERWSAADLRADVLVRNQHAADWSALTEFLAAVQPRIVVSSNAEEILEERLPAHLREWCAAHGCELWELQQTGMVGIHAWEDRLELNGWLDGRRQVVRAR